MKIVFATNNAHKLAEVQAVLGDAYELVTPRMCGVEEEIPENQPTLEGNASEKSHYLRARTGLDCFADDTGLEVEALDGAPEEINNDPYGAFIAAVEFETLEGIELLTAEEYEAFVAEEN